MEDPAVWFGDLRLWRQPVRPPEETDVALGVAHEFEGDQRTWKLQIADSPNLSCTLQVECVGAPGTNRTMDEWIQVKRAMRKALVERSTALFPLAYARDVAAIRVVQTYSAPTVTTTAPHGLTTGDRVLIRRASTVAWRIATVTVTGASTFTLTEVSAPSGALAIAGADEVIPLSAYWLDCRWRDMRVQNDEGYWAAGLVYGFRWMGVGDWSEHE